MHLISPSHMAMAHALGHTAQPHCSATRAQRLDMPKLELCKEVHLIVGDSNTRGDESKLRAPWKSTAGDGSMLRTGRTAGAGAIAASTAGWVAASATGSGGGGGAVCASTSAYAATAPSLKALRTFSACPKDWPALSIWFC